MNEINNNQPVSQVFKTFSFDKTKGQKSLQNLSTPTQVEQDFDFKVELSKLSKQMQSLAELDTKLVDRITQALRNNDNQLQKSYSYGKTDVDLVQEQMEDIQKEASLKPANSNTVQNEVRNSEVQQSIKDMIGKTGEYIDKHPKLVGQEDVEYISAADKANKEMGSLIKDKGVVRQVMYDEKSTPVQQVKENVENLHEKTGELIDKPPELTGKENTEEMTAAERANKELGNRIDGKGVKADKNDSISINEKIKQRIEEIKESQGSLVKLHPNMPGVDEGDETLQAFGAASQKTQEQINKEIEEQFVEMSAEEIDRLKNIAADVSVNMKEFTKTIDSLSESELENFISTAEQLDEEGLDSFVSTTSKLEGNTRENFITTSKELTETGGPNVEKFLQTVKSMENNYHVGETDLDRYLESVAQRSGIERTMFLLGRYMFAFY